MSGKSKLLVLVDGSSYLHRAFHALPPLANSKGEPTGAIYGVISMVRKAIADYCPDYLAVVFDAKGKNFRHELYPEYKATRPPMAEELKTQVNLLYEIIADMGVPLLMINGVEADDVIGSLSKMAYQHQLRTLISTGDKDLAQLVTSNITLVNTMTNTQLDEEGVKAKFGVRPDQIVDYLTLVGDLSDNIIGVAGVGPKTAVKWLIEYGTFNNIIKHQELIKGKVGENLRQSLGRLPLVKQLVTIKDDLKLDLVPEDLKIRAPDNKKLIELFTRLEFKSWLKELNTNEELAFDSSSNKYQLILTDQEFKAWLKQLHAAEQFSFDLETTSLEVMQAKIVGFSFAIKSGEAVYVPVAHTNAEDPAQLKLEMVLKELEPIFVEANKIKLGQNLKYDLGVLANYGINVAGVIYDTMLESYVLNSSLNKYDKVSLALRYLGKTITSYEDLVGKGAKQITFDQLPLAKALPYAAADADLVLQFHAVLWSELEKLPQLAKLCQEIEMPLVRVLMRVERYGVRIDPVFLQNYSSELQQRLDKLESKIYQQAASTFNINSPLQLQEILYKKLQLPVLQKTPTGQPSTAESVLQELALEYELPQLVLEYRSLSKLKSTYTDALPTEINATTGRIHTSYNQAVTTTGRLSSTNPNLQNIPIRTEEGRKIRQAFIATPGYKIISADYSQIELRVMAHLAEDTDLIAAFIQNVDIHRLVAAEIFAVPLDQVTGDQRRHAKTINFGLIYGMSAFGLAKRIGMKRNEAEKYIELYFNRYPGIRKYMTQIRQFAHQHGFVESIFGRRLYLPEIKSKNFTRRLAAERAAINAPIQGTAADIIKLAMIDLDHWLVTTGLDGAMTMQVHDELVFEVVNAKVDIAVEEIKKRMENVVRLKVPLVVEVGVGNNWDEAH